MLNSTEYEAVVLTLPITLCDEGSPRLGEMKKVTVSDLSVSSVSRTVAVHWLGDPLAKSKAPSAPFTLKLMGSLIMRANWPVELDTDTVSLQLMPTTSYETPFSMDKSTNIATVLTDTVLSRVTSMYLVLGYTTSPLSIQFQLVASPSSVTLTGIIAA